MKCLIYTRVSTDRQENDNQIAQLREFAEKSGWDIVDIITDVCSGGTTVNRKDQFGSEYNCQCSDQRCGTPSGGVFQFGNDRQPDRPASALFRSGYSGKCILERHIQRQ